MESALVDLAVSAFVTLIVVIDPLGTSPMFAAMTAGETEPFRRRLAVRAVAIAAVLLVAFAFAGEWFLRALGIGIASFRIAGGILLFMVAVDMLFAHGTPFRRATVGEVEEATQRHDISVFPLAIPLIAGPGAMTSVVLLMGDAQGATAAQLTVLAVLLGVLGLLLAALIFASRVVRLLGVTGINVVSRVLGLILAALAVQFVVDGLTAHLGAV